MWSIALLSLGNKLLENTSTIIISGNNKISLAVQ